MIHLSGLERKTELEFLGFENFRSERQGSSRAFDIESFLKILYWFEFTFFRLIGQLVFFGRPVISRKLKYRALKIQDPRVYALHFLLRSQPVFHVHTTQFRSKLLSSGYTSCSSIQNPEKVKETQICRLGACEVEVGKWC